MYRKIGQNLNSDIIIEPRKKNLHENSKTNNNNYRNNRNRSRQNKQNKNNNITSSTSYNNQHDILYVNNLCNNSSDFMQISPNSDTTTNSGSGSSESLASCNNDLKNEMGMNNYNTKVSSNNNNHKGSNNTPGTYSLDFLHYVGVQFATSANIPAYATIQKNVNEPAAILTTNKETNFNSMSSNIHQNSNYYNGTNGGDNNHHYAHPHHHARYPHYQNYHHNNNYHMYNRNYNNNHNQNKNHHRIWGSTGNIGAVNNTQWNSSRNNLNGHSNTKSNHIVQHTNANTINNNNSTESNNNIKPSVQSNFNNRKTNSSISFQRTNNNQNSNNCNNNISNNNNTSNLNNNNNNTHNGKSRSPTPSPKSKSPNNIENNKSTISPSCSNTTKKDPHNKIESVHFTETSYLTPNHIISSQNGYDSDSSLSFHKHEHHQPIYFTAIPNGSSHILDLQRITEEPIHGYYTFYGSHQNLTNCSSLISPGGGGGTIHKHNYSSNSSDAGINLIDDHNSDFNNGIIKNSGFITNNNNTNKKKNQTISVVATNGTGKHKHEKRSIFDHRLNDGHYNFTPPDRFLAKSHLMETIHPSESLHLGTEWDNISKNIWDRFIAAQQTEETYKEKILLWRFLYICIKKAFPKYGLYLVGSTITGFGTESSDIDMCLVTRHISNNDPRIEAVINLTELKNYIMNITYVFHEFNLIQAKVPILRFKDIINSFEVDLNFNNSVGVRNTHLLYCYQQMDWRLKPLTVIVKLWAQYHHINNAKNMTISSYSLVLMVIHYLQCGVHPSVLPCLHALYPEKFQNNIDLSNINVIETIKPYVSDNKQALGELFYQFLEYYSNFDYTKYAVSVRTASVIPIDECRQAKSPKNDPHQWTQLCIEEPFELTNTARSVYDVEIFEGIKSVFIASWKALHETMDLDSIFGAIFLTRKPNPTPTPPPL